MASTCDSSSEDEEEKRRISEVVKALNFESQSDSEHLNMNGCSNQNSFVEIEKQNNAKPSLRFRHEVEDEVMCIGSPQFRQHVGKKLMDVIDSLYDYEDKMCSSEISEKSKTESENVSAGQDHTSGVRLFRSSGFVNMKPKDSSQSSRNRSSTKKSRKSSRNSDSSSSDDDEDLKRIKLATVDGWSIIQAGGLKINPISNSPNMESSLEADKHNQGVDNNNVCGLNNVENMKTNIKKKHKKKKKEKSVEEICKNSEENVWVENPETQSQKRKTKKRKHKDTNNETNLMNLDVHGNEHESSKFVPQNLHHLKTDNGTGDGTISEIGKSDQLQRKISKDKKHKETHNKAMNKLSDFEKDKYLSQDVTTKNISSKVTGSTSSEEKKTHKQKRKSKKKKSKECSGENQA